MRIFVSQAIADIEDVDYISCVIKQKVDQVLQTILTCLISPLTADEFSEAMRNGRFEKIPKNIKSLVPEETYIDDIIKLSIFALSVTDLNYRDY